MSKHLSVRIPDDLWDIVTQYAGQQNRTVSNVVATLLRTALGSGIEVLDPMPEIPKEVFEHVESTQKAMEDLTGATVEKQFRKAAPRVIEQATEPEYRAPVPSIALNIPGVKLGKDVYKPYVPEKYRKGEKSKFFKS